MRDIKGLSVSMQKALIEVLKKELQPTSNGTTVMDVVGDGTDDYDAYPIIRVVPATITRDIDPLNRSYNYMPVFTVSIYLEMGGEFADAEVIGTLLELVDEVYNILDGYDFDVAIPDGAIWAQESSVLSDINTLESKTGTVLYCDIQYPMSIKFAE